jgi:hypothetical protein
LYVLFGGLLLYNLLSAGGAIEEVSRFLGRLEPEKEALAVGVVVGAAPFFESVTGFGVAVVISGPILLAAGFAPLRAAVLSSWGQCAVPWGALGVGTVIGADLAGMSFAILSDWSAVLSVPLFPVYAVAAVALAGGWGGVRRRGIEAIVLGAFAGIGVPEHPEGLEWVWGNTSKETTPDGKGRNGPLRALRLLGVELSDLQDQTLLEHREDHELVHTLYLYRKKANTLSRYSRWIPDFYEEGRMYPQPKVAAAVTGRVLYSDPNAQGIDKKETDEFRRCVRAEEGRAIVKGDFAQQELRIAAYYSKDKNMLETFANGEDIYLKTAAS